MTTETVTVRKPAAPSVHHLAPSAPRPPGARTLCGRVNLADTVTIADPSPMAARCMACSLKDPALGPLVSRRAGA